MTKLDPKAAAERLRAMLDGDFHYKAYRGKAPEGVPQMCSDLDVVLSALSTTEPSAPVAVKELNDEQVNLVAKWMYEADDRDGFSISWGSARNSKVRAQMRRQVRDVVSAIRSALAVPERPAGAMPTDPEWYERKAALEGDHEIGAGKLTATINPTADEIAEMEHLQFEALPKWAQGEITRLRAAAPERPAGGCGVEAAARLISKARGRDPDALQGGTGKDWLEPVWKSDVPLALEIAEALSRPSPALPAADEVEQALIPLAAIADEYSDSEDDEFQVWKDFDYLGATLPLKYFRAARRALAALRNDGGE